MQKQMILYVLKDTLYSAADNNIILTSLPNHFLESSSALECITVGDDPPWKDARIHAVRLIMPCYAFICFVILVSFGMFCIA